MADILLGVEPQEFAEGSVLSKLSEAALKGLSEPFADVKIATKTENFQAHRIKLAVSHELRYAQLASGGYRQTGRSTRSAGCHRSTSTQR